VKAAGAFEDDREAAGATDHPEEQGKADDEHEGGADDLERLDSVDAAPDDGHVEQPEGEEAVPDGVGPDCRDEDSKHGKDGLAADPALDAKPSAGDECAQDGGDICAENAEAGAHIDRKWDAVLRSSVGIEHHRNEDDEVAEEDGAERLFPAHAGGDETAGEHVGGDADRHRDPKRDVVVDAPGAIFGGDGGEVLVPEGVGEPLDTKVAIGGLHAAAPAENEGLVQL